MSTTTIVVTSRNDGYGGNLELRGSHALNTMIQHYDEVIYVDWNSPNDDSLINHLTLEGKENLRHIQVKRSDIEKINPKLLELPIVEVLGRNIGIRRAKSDWIVSSNIDIMPDELDTSNLEENVFYAVARRNVPVPFFQSVEKDFFSYCKKNVNKFEQAYIIENEQWAGQYNPWSLVVCCGDYQLAHSSLWNRMKGFEERMIYRDCADTNVMKKGKIYGDDSRILDLDVFHLDHSGHEMKVGGKSLFNSWDEYVVNFENTFNEDSWGLVDYPFFEEII
jgi:hypothetical protein